MNSTVKLSFRNLASNRMRFALTTFSVLMGVAFVVASFVLSDGLRSTFNSIVEDANVNVDASVRADAEFEEVQFASISFDESVLDVVESVDGVGHAQPGLNSAKIVPIKPDGEPMETFGPPILSFNWDDSELSPMSIEAGRAPNGPGEFAMDVDGADKDGFVLGETYDLIGTAGPEPFELVGITRFGEDNALAGAVLLSFTLDELQRIDDNEGKIHWIDVSAAEGTTPEQLVANLQAALPDGVEAVSSDVIVEEDQDDFTVIVDIFGNILLAFALVTVFVSTFIIANTFNILLGQRVRQLALLRALGASSGQVRASALMEATIIGLLASVLGLGMGVLLAIGLRGLMNSLGFSLPDLEIIVSLRTVIWALVVGVGVTLVAALTPARRAARVPPVAAMREGYRLGSGEGTRRTIIAIILAVLGLAGISWSLFGDPGNTMLILILLGGGRGARLHLGDDVRPAVLESLGPVPGRTPGTHAVAGSHRQDGPGELGSGQQTDGAYSGRAGDRSGAGGHGHDCRQFAEGLGSEQSRLDAQVRLPGHGRPGWLLPGAGVRHGRTPRVHRGHRGPVRSGADRRR